MRYPVPHNGMVNNRNLPINMNINQYEKPIQSPYWGAEVTNPDCSTIKQRMMTTAARCPTPQNEVTSYRSWPEDINTVRYEKPVHTTSRGDEVTKPDCVKQNVPK